MPYSCNSTGRRGPFGNKESNPGFTYETDGIDSALIKAKAVAGDKNIWIMGGANIIQQYLHARLLDSLHKGPVLFTKGTHLFDQIGADQIELNIIKVIDTPGATQILYEFTK